MRSVSGGVVAVAVSLATLGWAVMDLRTATVTVHVPLHPVAVSATLTGGRLSGQLPTRYFSTTVTETMTGTSSQVTLSTYATGMVVFSYWSACTRDCRGEIQVPAGSDVATAAGVHYTTLAPAWFGFTSGWSSSGPTPVRAVNAGPAGNAGPGTLTVLPQPGNMSVTNPQPIVGGTNRSTHVVQQQDLDATSAELTSMVAADALNIIKLEDGGAPFVADSLTKMTVTSDHKAGEETPTFTMTATIQLNGNAFSGQLALKLLRAKLQSELLPGQTLASWSVSTNYTMVKMTDGGDVTVVGWANGQATPSINTGVLRELIASKSPAEAAATAHEWVPGSTVDIRVAPLNLPWLPSDPDRITLVIAGT